MSLSQNLRTMRMVTRETQRDLAGATRIPLATIIRVENGAHTDGWVLDALARHYRLSVDKLTS